MHRIIVDFSKLIFGVVSFVNEGTHMCQQRTKLNPDRNMDENLVVANVL
jgi:hypothetical protein